MLALAVRWVLDHGPTIALWGARNPGQLDPVAEIAGWHIDKATMRDIDAILSRCIKIAGLERSMEITSIVAGVEVGLPDPAIQNRTIVGLKSAAPVVAMIRSAFEGAPVKIRAHAWHAYTRETARCKFHGSYDTLRYRPVAAVGPNSP